MLEESLRTMIREEVRAVVRDELRALSSVVAPVDGEAEFIDIKSAARTFSVSAATIHNWAKTGRLRKHAVGGVVRIKRSELLSLIEASGAEPAVDVATLAREMLRKGR